MNQRALRTRAAIIRAAAEVFDESGYRGAGINRILARAKVTSGAMYFHFASKEELARAVMLEQASDLKLPEDPQGLQQLVDITFALARELQHNTLLRAGVRLAVDPGGPALQDDSAYGWWADRFRGELVVARHEGELRPDTDESEFAEVLVSAFTGTQLKSQISAGWADLPDRIASLWRYLLPGIASPEALPGILVESERGLRWR
ncbi:ScbR family autoregulator-binding transcription factor [Streptomyces sp. NL15-2K]|uniref:ScbR family autoregulator-binding transcription factor n=1 Tax=Streptomyces sp. NL15-2K TaxID=376149 RepID=UPI000F55D5F3|nr:MULTISPECIES: ScbR family autoregulator-binding transcription factor [Actinomycetes]WKX07868.1 ScbR family autoregulator-binding transcription factor [Kutzneria buriramensis]GCB50691.1 tetR family transcriptional regulator [Streptomyces sp. NL15-2K]